MSLVNDLIHRGYLKTPLIIEAFKKIKRADFLPEEIKNLAELDDALSIGFGQTISQPAVVAFMLELLQPRPGDKILDIGAGSGWTTSLLAYCVSAQGISNFQFPISKQISNSKPQVSNGRVVAMEIIPELKKFGEKNVLKYNFIKRGIVKFVCGDGSKGYPKEAPYDKILVSAAAQKECPKDIKEQLKINGRIVIPIENSIWLFVKKSNDMFKEYEYPGFVFVPLV